MYLKNTSRYPTDEVEVLLAYAADGFDLTAVAAHVKNSQHAYAGMAYPSVPRFARRNAHASARMLVTLRLGAPGKFPADNLRTTQRWVDEHHDDVPECGFVENVLGLEYGSPEYREWWRTHRIWTCHRGGVQVNRVQRLETRRGPYGGRGSPLIEMRDWREGLVALAAHEFTHIHQFQNNLRRSEVHAEQSAARRLERYRSASR